MYGRWAAAAPAKRFLWAVLSGVTTSLGLPKLGVRHKINEWVVVKQYRSLKAVKHTQSIVTPWTLPSYLSQCHPCLRLLLQWLAHQGHVLSSQCPRKDPLGQGAVLGSCFNSWTPLGGVPVMGALPTLDKMTWQGTGSIFGRCNRGRVASNKAGDWGRREHFANQQSITTHFNHSHLFEYFRLPIFETANCSWD